MGVKKNLELIGQYWLLMERVFTKPEKWCIFRKQYVTEAYKLIIDSLPIVSIISIFIGAVIVLQTAYNMRITEQIDAMEIMGVNSANYLILPKIASATTLSPFVMLASFMIGLLGGALIVIFTGVINLGQYIDGIQFAFKPYYVYYSMTKMAVFAFIITSVSSFYGYYAKGGSLGVGRSSTKAIVISSGLILVFNLLITKIML